MNLGDIKNCLAGLYGTDLMAAFILKDTGKSLLLYFNDVIPTAPPGKKDSVAINASTIERVDDPNWIPDPDRHGYQIPQVTQVRPASIRIAGICKPFDSQPELVRLMMTLYPARLTIEQIIMKTQREEEELRQQQQRRRTAESIHVGAQSARNAFKMMVSQIVARSIETPGCDVGLLGKTAAWEEIISALGRMEGIMDEINFPSRRLSTPQTLLRLRASAPVESKPRGPPS